MYHSTLGLIVIKKQKLMRQRSWQALDDPSSSPPAYVFSLVVVTVALPPHTTQPP